VKYTIPFAILLAVAAVGQTTGRTSRKTPQIAKPECAAGAVCFSGEVKEGEEFRKAINSDLEFVLQPGWRIAVFMPHPQGQCEELASMVNFPLMQHNFLEIDASYDWTAEQEVTTSPREFRFVTNCVDFEVEYERFQIWGGNVRVSPEKKREALEKLGTSASGRGKLWITDSRTTHAHFNTSAANGEIEWISSA
jgi:hypothetical protein